MSAVRIFTSEDVERMRYMYEDEGRASAEIAVIMNCYHTTVRKYLRESGVQMRKKGGSTPLKKVTHREMEVIRFLYVQREWTIRMIARYLGVTDCVVRHRMKMGGIPRRDRTEAMKLAYKYGRAHNPHWRNTQQEKVAA